MTPHRTAVVAMLAGLGLLSSGVVSAATLTWDYGDSAVDINLRVEITDDQNSLLCEDVDQAGAVPASPDTWYSAAALCEGDSGDSHAEGDAYTGNHDGDFHLNGRTGSWIDWPEYG